MESRPGFQWHAADFSAPGSLAFAESLRPDFVLATFTPTETDIPGYRRGFTQAAANLLKGLGGHRVRKLIMISSTRVYAEEAGAWVDESSALSDTDQRAMAIIDAERLLLNSRQHATVVRFGGIYGDRNGRLLSRIARGQISPARPARYTNRIHREDCAGFLVHLLLLAQQNHKLSAVYNGVDNDPAPAHEVESWLAAAMGITGKDTDDRLLQAKVSHKRCRNELLRSSGYELLYPDFRAGYRQVLGVD